MARRFGSAILGGLSGSTSTPLPRRALPHAAPAAVELAAPLTVGLTLGLLAHDSGGWYPSAWDWAAVASTALAACALIVTGAPRLTRLETYALSAFAALTSWTGSSWIWSESGPQSELELERCLMYFSGVAAVLLIARRASLELVPLAILAAGSAVCLSSLWGRLFPAGTLSLRGNAARLGGPWGYPNGLGAIAAVGLILVLGVALDSNRRVPRCAAVALVPVFASTLLYTFSRGAWLALAVGLAAVIAISPSRRRVVVALAALSADAALAVWLSSRAASASAASHAGHVLAVELAALAIAGALAAWVSGRMKSRRRAHLAVVALLVVIAAIAALLAAPTASTHSSSATASLTTAAPPPGAGGASPAGRVFATGSDYRSDYWRVAVDDFFRNPVLGSGAGTFAVEWLKHRHIDQSVQDAHSLYLETAAELGAVGFLLLIFVLAVPFVAAVRARHRRFVLGAFGGYVAVLAQAAVDWDWELPAVMFIGLFCGALLLVAARGPRAPSPPSATRWLALAGVAAALAFAFVCLVGNRAYAIALRAAWQGDWVTADAQARRAGTWTPWAAYPFVVQADAADVAGNRTLAVSLLAEATRKDSHNADLWDRLAAVTTGGARTHARAEAVRLDPPVRP